MAVKTVTGKLTGPDNANIAGVLVTAQLSQSAVIAATQEVAPVAVTTLTSSTGTWSLSLQANNDMTPTGTYYTVTAGIWSATAVVPTTAGPFVIENITTNPPTASPTPSHVSTLIVDGTSGMAVNAAGDMAVRSLTASSTSPYAPNAHVGQGISIGTDPATTIPSGGLAVIPTSPSATDAWSSEFFRNAQYTGGAPGFTNFALKVQTDVGANPTAYEWALLAQLNNSATAGQNVAFYGQAKKKTGAGPTWAGVFENIDDSNAADPTTGMLGLEIDISANGTDANTNRIGIDMYVRKYNSGGTAATAYSGIRIQQSDTSHWKYGLIINDASTAGILLQSGVAGSAGIQFAGTQTFGINFTGTVAVGIGFDSGTFTTAALRFARQQLVSLEATSVLQLQMFGAADSILKFMSSSVEKIGLNLSATPRLRMNTVDVLTTRQTGYTNLWTGTLERATAYDASTVTLVQLAQRVAAIQTDLASHGLIGV